jgi:hypothetical protein
MTAPTWATIGTQFIFSAASSARDIVFRNSGNIRCPDGTTLDHAADRIVFVYDGTNFVMISFSNNAT